MTRQVRLAKHVGINGPQVPLAPDLTSGLAATAKVTGAQLGPQEAASTLAALAGLHASSGPRLIAAGL